MTLDEIISELKEIPTSVAYYVAGFGFICLTPYIIPSISATLKNDHPKCAEHDDAMALGAGLGTLGLAYQCCIMYVEPTLLTIPVATNTASYIYEKIRGRKKEVYAIGAIIDGTPKELDKGKK